MVEADLRSVFRIGLLGGELRMSGVKSGDPAGKLALSRTNFQFNVALRAMPVGDLSQARRTGMFGVAGGTARGLVFCFFAIDHDTFNVSRVDLVGMMDRAVV